MKILITDFNTLLKEKLVALGHEVTMLSLNDRLGDGDYDEPKDYPLWALAQSHDAVIMCRPIFDLPDGTQFAYWTGWARKCRNARIVLVMYSEDDPAVFTKFRNRQVRPCGCRPHDAHIYMTHDDYTAKLSAEKRRTVYIDRKLIGWDASPLARAIEDVRSRRDYSPKKNGRDYWGN